MVTVNTSGSKGLIAGSLQWLDYCKHTSSSSWMIAPAAAPSYYYYKDSGWKQHKSPAIAPMGDQSWAPVDKKLPNYVSNL